MQIKNDLNHPTEQNLKYFGNQTFIWSSKANSKIINFKFIRRKSESDQKHVFKSHVMRNRRNEVF